MKSFEPLVVYWDSSALISGLFRDAHSEEANQWSRREGYHLMSTLAWTEVLAVLSRIRRERVVTDFLVDAAFQAMLEGPWRRLSLEPDWDSVKRLSEKWPLRGSDLWHLSTALTLKKERPELVLLTFDNRLKVAAQGENLMTQ